MEEELPPIPNLRENLVAYLDGELDDVATVEIEKGLTESAEIRQELEELARTWELLEQLPRVQASTEFTERTLASIQTSAEPEVTKPLFSPEARRRAFGVALLAGLVLCSLLGYLGANLWIPRPSDPLIQDLPVIEKLDLLEDVGDLKLLEELKERGSLDELKSLETQHDNN